MKLITLYRVGIFSASYPHSITWLAWNFWSTKEAYDWADKHGCYRNVEVQEQP